MIEQALYFTLGFLIMGLFGLVFLPFYWQRAVRLSTRRLEAQLPLSMAEIAAEKDSLRAEFAVEKRRVEQLAEAAQNGKGMALAELGRRTGQLTALAGEFAALEARAGQLELAAGHSQRAHAEAEAALAAANVEIHDANGHVLRSENQYHELADAHLELIQNADGQRTTIAALETRISGLEIRLNDTVRLLENVQAARDAIKDEATGLRVDLAATSARLREAQRLHAAAASSHASAEELRSTLQANLAASSERVNRLQSDLGSQTRLASSTAAELADALRREKELRASLQRQMDMARASDASLAKRVESLRTENAGLQNQLAALQAQLAEAARDKAAANHGMGDELALGTDMAQLREAISDIGHQMIRLNRSMQLASGIEAPLTPDALPPLPARVVDKALAN